MAYNAQPSQHNSQTTNRYYGSVTILNNFNNSNNNKTYDSHHYNYSLLSRANITSLINTDHQNHQHHCLNITGTNITTAIPNTETSSIIYMTSDLGSHYHDHRPKRHSPNSLIDCSIENKNTSTANSSVCSTSQEFRPSITRALDYCQDEVLPSYKTLLLLLGWHPFNIICCPNLNCLKVLVNLLHVMILLSIICFAHILQYVSCFRHNNFSPIEEDVVDLKLFEDQKDQIRSHSMIESDENFQYFNLTEIFYDLDLDSHHNQIVGSSYKFLLSCHNGSAVTNYWIPSLIHLVSFVIILRHLRFCEVDRFHNLCLLNLLLSTKIIGHKKACWEIKKTVRYWMLVVLSFSIIIIIHLAFRLFYLNDLSFPACHIISNGYMVQIGLKAICFVLFSFIELIHISIISIYALYCQMNIIFIKKNLVAIREKRIDFQEFAKNTEIFKMNINFLNNRYSLSVSLVLIYIATKTSSPLIDLFSKCCSNFQWLPFILTISSMIYWFSLMAIPLYQAACLTNACESICDIGHELCARPFCYQQTARDDLDSLLTYTSSLNLDARLLMISVRPSCILSIILFLIFIILISSQFHLLDI